MMVQINLLFRSDATFYRMQALPAPVSDSIQVLPLNPKIQFIAIPLMAEKILQINGIHHKS